jgi:hypothetical protein
MTVVLVVGAIAVVAAIVVGATWHRSADEGQSVRNYQHTLETLRLVSNRNAGRHLHVTASSEGAASRDLAESEALIGRSGAPQAGNAVSVGAAREAGGRKTLVFRDDPGRSLPGTPAKTVSELASGGPLYRQRRPAHAGIALRPRRRGLLTAFAVVVVFAAAVSAVVVGTSGSPRGPGVSSGRSASSHRSTPSTGARSSSAAHGSSGAHPTIQPTDSSTTAASYPAPTGAYTVGLSASGPCWVLATDVATGQVVWTGTLQADGQQQIQATGSLHVRLGAAFDVAVVLDGSPVVLPPGHVSPFDLTFEAT